MSGSAIIQPESSHFYEAENMNTIDSEPHLINLNVVQCNDNVPTGLTIQGSAEEAVER